MRRLILLLPLLLLPAACGDSPLREVAAQLLPPRSAGGESLPPGPGLRLSLGGAGVAAQLLREQGDRRLWRSADGVAVEMQGPRVVATAGLPVMLAASRLEGPDPLADPAALVDRPAEYRRVVDLMGADREPENMRFGLAFDCRAAAQRQGELLLVAEECRGEEGGHSNRFRILAATGEVVESEQWIGPGLPALRIRHPQH
ncbi:MAG: YjbF family lipoprotein [Rhodovarius sp.]|nr:YjbF family lipoprotein [Rhodovarius sp.]